MTSNVLPLHFAPSQASSSQNSNVDDTLEIESALPYKIFLTLLRADCSNIFTVPHVIHRAESGYTNHQLLGGRNCGHSPTYDLIFSQILFSEIVLDLFSKLLNFIKTFLIPMIIWKIEKEGLQDFFLSYHEYCFGYTNNIFIATIHQKI